MKNLLRRVALLTVSCSALLLTVRGTHAQHRAFLSLDLTRHLARQTALQARVIVQGSDADLDAIAARHHVTIVRRLEGAAVVLANSAELADLASDGALDHLSGDVPVRMWMSVSNQATAADQVRAGTSGLLGIGGIAAVNGKGIGVAIVDSGVSAQHAALSGKVVASVSKVSTDSSTGDAFGHGTHVAGIIAGSPTATTPLYTGGIAPGAQIINVRVLGGDGSGLTSDVIAGIDWVIANRTKYNIRIINLSLGHPVFEPCATDPLCQEVKKAYDAGIAVIAAAGNYGRNAAGQMVLGSIASPGNSPYAITVAATNTWGTVGRSDDTVATFSSRGPTQYDLVAKPDLAAPGVKIVSAQANNSYLPQTYPVIHVAGSGNNAYMFLSGTSMAAPMVSGAAALLLQGSPNLTPAQLKMALQAGAAYMSDGGLLGAGAGNANFWASRQYAANGLVVNLPLSTIAGTLTGASGAFWWDAGTLIDNVYGGLGTRLLSAVDALLLWLNPTLVRFGDLNLLGLGNPLASMVPKWLLYGDVAGWTDAQSIAWGTTIYDPNGQSIAWGTDAMDDDSSIAWGTSMTSPDAR
jgi:serine protease AprX